MARLEQSGIFLSYERSFSPDVLGFPLQAFVSIGVRQTELPRIINELSRIPEVVQAHGLSGSIDLLARGLIGVGRLLRELVRAAVDGGVGMENELLLCLPHRQWALGGSPRIQVHQRLIAAHGALQDWELLPNCVYIKSRHESS